MSLSLQSDGSSPKEVVNGMTSLKTASDSGENSGVSSHFQVKGKKRERGDHDQEQVERECRQSDDADALQNETEANRKSVVMRIMEKGGLTEVGEVEKLVLLMQPDGVGKKLDLGSRAMFSGVIAATENVDCLNMFMEHRSLPILDQWLLDFHNGELKDGNALLESDKSVEEFLLVLLHALDKLPVNLHALQMCTIGRSVNRLRSHVNLEIQRKARSLVDVWKRRIEAEMIGIDAYTRRMRSNLMRQRATFQYKIKFIQKKQAGTREFSASLAKKFGNKRRKLQYQSSKSRPLSMFLGIFTFLIFTFINLDLCI